MAINRTAFNALVDDSGLGLDGSPWDKATIASVLLDPIDAGFAVVEQTTSATGAQNNFNLGAHLTYLRCTGAAPSFSGFTVLGAAPSAGDRVILDGLGTTAKVTTEDTNSTAANRIICPSGTSGQIVGFGGRMELLYDGTTSRWREALVSAGSAIAIPYASLTFSGSGSLVWTVAAGDFDHLTYTQDGTTVLFSVRVTTTTVSGTGNTLVISQSGGCPGGFTPPTLAGITCRVIDNGATVIGFGNPASTGLRFTRSDAANFAAATDATQIDAQILCMGIS